MKNLRIAMIALILTTIVHSCSGQTSVNSVTGLVQNHQHSEKYLQHSVEYIDISGKVLNSESKRVNISLYILEDDCTWTELESRNDNKYSFLLERDQEYQVWFNDERSSKILYVDPGYTGDYAYDVNVNFETNDCVRLSPDDKGMYDMYVMTFHSMTPLLYPDSIID